MTRETKIGLLVGLAFIIVIGILLSDHLTSSTEPAQAPLGQVGRNTRESIATQGQPSVPVVVETPQTITPRGPVVTVEEMRTPATPAQPTQPATPVVVIDNTNVTPTSPVNANDPLAKLVQQHGNELAMVGPAGQQVDTQTPTGPTTPTVPTATSFKEYKAQEGDSLSRIAGRLMGANTKANRDAIVAANPTLKADPNKVVVGRTYLIPTSANLVPANVVATAQQTQKTFEPKATEAKAVAASDPGTVWYTVKENDNLWKIAAEQLGTGTAWTTIKEMNKEVLKGSDSVRKDMRLKLPAKPGGATATASARD
jgi:nucleoid-associated protein YgaU